LDIKIPDIGVWHSLFQTNPDNTDDGKTFVYPGDGTIGSGYTGYTRNGLDENKWYRFTITVDLSDTSDQAIKFYVNGIREENGNYYQELDNRFSFGSVDEAVQLLLFADDNEEDGIVEVAKASIFDYALSATEVAGLGGFQHISNELTPVAKWDFNDASNLTAATIGAPLELIGDASAVEGPEDGNGAVSIGVGSHFKATTPILPNGGGLKVNTYSLSIDLKVDSWSSYISLFQTNPLNDDDGDLFLTAPDQDIGLGDLGYSGDDVIVTNDWHRMILVANSDETNVAVDIYIDGYMVLNGTLQPVDSRMALDNVLLLFADNDGEDNLIEISQVAIYDSALTSKDVSVLGGYDHGSIADAVVGLWEFNDASQLTKATIGQDLVLTDLDGGAGLVEAVDGPDSDGAVKIDTRNHFVAKPDLLPNGGGDLVNRYSIAFDFKIEELGVWRSFYNTDSLNDTDGEFFIHPDGFLGIGTLGYADSALVENEWYRLVIAVDLVDTTSNSVRYYIDGKAVDHGTSDVQKVDQRFAFQGVGNENQLFLLADDNGDDGLITCSKIVLYDRPLTAEEVDSIGGFGHSLVGVNDNQSITPDQFKLNQNYPNPFNPTTIISYSIPQQSKVELKVYNLLGQLVTTLVNQTQNAGQYEFQFDAGHLSSGVYFYTFKAGSFTKSAKMMLLK
jgi:hypothetical protein